MRRTRCWAFGFTGCCRRSSCRPPSSPSTTTTSLPGGAALSTTCPQSNLPCERSATKTSADVQRKPSDQLRQEELQTTACEAGVDFGTDPAKPLAMKKFVSHATCRDSLGLQEQELYLIVGETSDLWRIKSDYSYVLGRETFLMLWPADGDASKKELRDQLEEFSEYMRTHGCQS
ncbi:complement C3-like isoform X1 [Pongo pygmaeus]|uniref:complement C3-like isoform X1 n=1 Tax=Pongo pygmaeus TaxID=9600 RepID=UPI0023E1004A|nr:complement C3-like isoform X1 [Pongo pygmaeus]